MVSPLWVWLEEIESGADCILSSEEARHVASRRLRVGDRLVVFDANGRRAAAELVSAERRSVRIRVGSAQFDRAATTGLRVASAIPKGDRLSVLLQMATQLGLLVWQPLVLENSSIRKLDPDSPRLRRLGIEACKVARRTWAMDVRSPLDLSEALSSCDSSNRIAYGDRDGMDSATYCAVSRPDWVFIGPEAGFSSSEIRSLAEMNATSVSLGALNLRIETAVVAAAAVFGRSVNELDGANDLEEREGEDGQL